MQKKPRWRCRWSEKGKLMQNPRNPNSEGEAWYSSSGLVSVKWDDRAAVQIHVPSMIEPVSLSDDTSDDKARE